MDKTELTLAQEQTEAHRKKEPGAFVSKWETQLSQTLEKLLSRPDFTYTPESDPAYQAYRSAYVRKGRRAMEDTLGKATALTGGYGNSYALTAGQQTYDGYLQSLTDKIPDLYQLAQSRYDKMTLELRQTAELLREQQEAEKKDYDDAYDRWLSQLSLLLKQENEAADRDRWEQEFHQKYPDAGGDGGTEGSGGTASGGAGYDNGSVSEENIRKIQAALGVTVDGKWGPESRKAAGDVDADTAWANYCSEFG